MTTDLSMYLDQAQRAGADMAEVFYSRSFSRPVFFEANRLKQLESSESEGMALRLWKNGCPGLAVAYGPVAPEILVAKALNIATLNPPKPPRFVSPRREYRESFGTDIAVEQLIDWGQTAIASVREKFPEVLCSGELACSTDSTRLLNSEGLDCAWTESSLSYYLGVEWIRGDDFLAIYDGEQCRGLGNIDQVVQNLQQRLIWARQNQTLSGGKMPVLFTSGAASLLWDTVAEALNGQRVVEGASPWADRLGEKVAVPALSMGQEPTASPFDCPFDDEGSPSQKLVLIQAGEIGQFYTDQETGAKLGTPSTGNGFRPGLGSAPQPSLINLIIEPGKASFSQLLQALGNGLVVDQILGGGADISGDFSINVDLGYRVQNGQITGRVKDTMVSGNVYELLQQIQLMGGDRCWQGSCYTPSLILDGVSVTV